MASTVLEAVGRLQTSYLDDPDGVRWPDAECKVALRSAQDSCLRDLIDSGCDALKAVASVTTGATGEYDMTALAPIRIHGVYITLGGVRLRLNRASTGIHSLAGQIQTVMVEYSGGVVWSDTDAHYILGDGAGGAVVEVPSLEEWIIARAALTCLAKEPNPRRSGASESEGMYRATCIKSLTERRGSMMNRGSGNVINDLYQYSYNPLTNMLVTGRSARGYV